MDHMAEILCKKGGIDAEAAGEIDQGFDDSVLISNALVLSVIGSVLGLTWASMGLDGVRLRAVFRRVMFLWRNFIRQRIIN